MRKALIRTTTLLACVGLAACAVQRPESVPGVLILQDVAIVDAVTGRVSAPRSVLIEAGTIAAIEDSPGPDWPAAERPPTAGLFLTPALYDTHVHIFDERDLRTYALGGIQVVRNMDGWPWHLALRDKPPEPGRPRARLITAGSQLQRPEIVTAEDALQRVTEEQSAGYDWVKLYDGLPKAALEGLASRPALLVTGHLPARVPLPKVLQSGVYDDVAHAEELSHALGRDYPEGEAGLDALAIDMLAAGTALTTTIVNNQMIAEQVADIEANLGRPEVTDAPPLLQAFWRSKINPWAAPRDAETAEGFARQVRTLMKIASGLHKRGVVLLAGTDAPNPTTVPAASLHQELALLVEAGLSPADALRAATVAAADHLEPGSRGARIETGAAANFILSRENPLQDIGALQRYQALVFDGAWLSRESAEAQRRQIRDDYARDLRVLTEFAPDSPAGVLKAIEASQERPPISPEGLTSLVWFYMKIGNLDAAGSVAERLAAIHPSPESDRVLEFITERRERKGQASH